MKTNCRKSPLGGEIREPQMVVNRKKSGYKQVGPNPSLQTAL